MLAKLTVSWHHCILLNYVPTGGDLCDIHDAFPTSFSTNVLCITNGFLAPLLVLGTTPSQQPHAQTKESKTTRRKKKEEIGFMPTT